MKLFICSFLLLFHVNFVSTLSTAIDNGSETSFSTFLTTLPKIAETKQVNGKIALLTDGVVNLDVDSVFYLEVYDEKIDNNEEGIFFCFKAKKESTIPGLKKCPKNYCDVHVRYSNYTGKVISAFVLMGDAKEILFSERTKTEIRESTMAVNAGQTTSRACTWDYSSGYLPVELMNKQHRKVYLTNAKLHNANNATAETPMAEGTVGGIIVGAIIGGVVVIGG
uniref:Uncharacterized protein n=1 Tax=Panagrolaimus sp. JU765 TaxID=591449 RepID=A0AC34Q0Y0_9BILA